MSYILDALRKAEAERERGHVPNIYAQQPLAGAAVPVAETPRSTPWLTIGAAVLVALLIGAGLVWWRLGAGTPAPVVALATPNAVSPAPTPTTTRNAETSSGSVSPSTTPPPTPPLPATPAAPMPEERKPKVEPARAATTPNARPATAAGGNPAPVAPQAQMQMHPQAQMPATRSTAPETGDGPMNGKIYAMNELPEAVRSQLPALTVGGSMYSPVRTNRVLIINNQAASEGAQIAPDLVLEQIRVKSAVLGFKGYRFVLPF